MIISLKEVLLYSFPRICNSLLFFFIYLSYLHVKICLLGNNISELEKATLHTYRLTLKGRAHWLHFIYPTLSFTIPSNELCPSQRTYVRTHRHAYLWVQFKFLDQMVVDPDKIACWIFILSSNMIVKRNHAHMMRGGCFYWFLTYFFFLHFRSIYKILM